VGGDRLPDFDAGDVLATGDDDVLAAIAQLKNQPRRANHNQL
jgi:hypothetical protein